MFKVNSTIHNIPVYQNTDIVAPVYKNNDIPIIINNWSNTTVNLLSVEVIPKNPIEIFKTKRYALRILPGNTIPTDISNLVENGLIAPLDIFTTQQTLDFYLLEHTGLVTIQIELMDISNISSISHLLSLPSLSRITLKEGSKLSSVTASYLQSVTLNNASILLDFDVYISNNSYQVLANLLILTENRKIKRFTKPVEGQYITGYLQYASSIYSKAINLDLWNIYSQTSKYVYLIGDSDVY